MNLKFCAGLLMKYLNYLALFNFLFSVCLVLTFKPNFWLGCIHSRAPTLLSIHIFFELSPSGRSHDVSNPLFLLQ